MKSLGLYTKGLDLELAVDYLGLYSQVTKSMRWMPWRQKAMKDVVVCDKPGGVDNKRYIPGFPNGETQPV